MARHSSLETSTKPSINLMSRNHVEKSKQVNTKNKIHKKSVKQKMRKDMENMKRKAATKTMKRSRSVIFTSTDLDDFNHKLL